MRSELSLVDSVNTNPRKAGADQRTSTCVTHFPSGARQPADLPQTARRPASTRPAPANLTPSTRHSLLVETPLRQISRTLLLTSTTATAQSHRHLPWPLPGRTCAAPTSVRRRLPAAALNACRAPILPVVGSPSRANLPPQSSRTPNRPRTSRMETCRVSRRMVDNGPGCIELTCLLGTMASTLPMAAVSTALLSASSYTTDMAILDLHP